MLTSLPSLEHPFTVPHTCMVDQMDRVVWATTIVGEGFRSSKKKREKTTAEHEATEESVALSSVHV